MRGLRACLFLGVLLPGCSTSSQLKPFPRVTPHVVRASTAALPELTAQLGSEDWRVRERAEEQIVVMGEDAAPHLRRLAATGGDAETVARARDALRRVEEMSPTRVSLDLRRTPVHEAFRVLGERAGVTFDVNISPGASPLVTDRFDALPFWTAVQRLCRATRTKPFKSGEQPHTIAVRWEPFPFADRACVSGPLFIALDWGPARSSDPATGVIFGARVYADPRIKVLRGPAKLKLTDVRDEHGRSLLEGGPTTTGAAKDDEADLYLPRNPMGSAWQWQLNTAIPPSAALGAARRLSVLRGTIPLEVRSAAVPWVLEGPAEPAALGSAAHAGGGTVTLVEAARLPPDRGWRFVLELARVPGGPRLNAVSVRRFLDALRVQAFDAAGQQFPPGHHWMESAGDGSRYRLTWIFSAPDGVAPETPPARLAFEFPTHARPFEIPFEFVDVPIQ